MNMNVLLLALSTISNPNLNSYEYQFKNEKPFVGFYQLEPIPKFLNERLTKINEKLDYIITLNTEEVNKTKFSKVSHKKEGKEQFSYENINAAEFFERVLLSGDKALKELPKIISVPIDVDNIIPGIAKAMDELRLLKKKSQSFHLWMDMHGGPRNTQMTFQTILSLLKHESIYPEGIFTIIMNRDKPNTIKDDTKYFDYIDFVSGMNEFINFGKPISMKGNILSKDAMLKEFTEKANRISDALTLCDMEGFQNGLSIMSEWLKDYAIKEYSLLELFISNIQSDYGILLDDKHDIIDEIEWCLKKGYLQQAMTLIESKMPGELLKKNIISYDENFRLIEMGKNASNNIYTTSEAIRLGKISEKKRWESDINYLFIKWIKELEILDLDDDGYEIPIKLDKTRSEYSNFMYNYRPNINNLIKIYIDSGRFVRIKIFVNRRIIQNLKQKDNLVRFLLLHYALKQERNSVNHAGERGRTTAKNISEAIGGYIDLAKKIYKE